MKMPSNTWKSYANKASSDSPVIDETTVRPYGAYGAGIFTAHPVGLVISAGLALLVLVSIPAARWFLAGSVALGAVFGFFLWLRHR